MSIKVMTRVWEHAPYKESTLLVLLALADYADDHGICYPDVPTLAAKARVSDRRAIDIIKDLEEAGAIAFHRGGGRGKRSCYAVLVGLTDEQKERVKEFHRNYFTENKTVKLGAQKGEVSSKKRVNYSVKSQPDSPQQEASNPDPIRHGDPSYDPSEREKSKKQSESPARTPAVQAYFDTYSSETLKPDQVAAINRTVTDLAHWRKVLAEWSLNGWSAKGIGKMLDRYSSGRTAKDERPGVNGQRPADTRPSLPVYQPPTDRPPAEQSKKTLAEKAREFTP